MDIAGELSTTSLMCCTPAGQPLPPTSAPSPQTAAAQQSMPYDCANLRLSMVLSSGFLLSGGNKMQLLGLTTVAALEAPWQSQKVGRPHACEACTHTLHRQSSYWQAPHPAAPQPLPYACCMAWVSSHTRCLRWQRWR